VTFSAAGADDDVRAAYLERQVKARKQRGDGFMSAARGEMRADPTLLARERAEKAARQALASYASALDWAEDTDREEEAHRQLDEAGRWVRRTFGCLVHQDGMTYSQRCPVALAHNRVGLSIGGAAKRICSLCGSDLSECEHMRGTSYLVPGGPSDLGWCRVCLKDSCDHEPSQEYRVGVVARIIDLELVEVSIVSKPANPEARFTSIGLDLAQLQGHLGPEFRPGMPVSCDRCLSSCNGLTRHQITHLQ